MANFQAARERMVECQIAKRGVNDPRVLAAMRAIPREKFVPKRLEDRAYEDGVLPIGARQTISQPVIVAYMLEQLALEPHHRVLEIGTGSAYNTALLAELAAEVYSIETVPMLHANAQDALANFPRFLPKIHLRLGDGYEGWKEKAPFDAIVLTAAPPRVPEALLEQLAVNGRLIAPEGVDWQCLNLYEKSAHGLSRRELLPVRFVPMVKR